MLTKTYYVYIITNKNNTTFYIGATDSLIRRMYEHKNELVEGFSKRYRLKKLVYYEETSDINSAIAREKQLKNWHREWKINLIKKDNPGFEDLAVNWFKEMPKRVRHDNIRILIIGQSACYRNIKSHSKLKSGLKAASFETYFLILIYVYVALFCNSTTPKVLNKILISSHRDCFFI